jgi:hypothetical protein
MAEIAGKGATIKVSGTATSFTAEETSTSDNQSYQIDAAAKQVWDRDTAPTVYEDDVETTETYTVDYLQGIITFEDADALRGTVTVTGKYLPMATATYAHEFSYNKGCDLMEVNKFGDSYKSRLAGLKYASGTLSQWDVTADYYKDALVAGNPVVIEFTAAAGEDEKRVWALLESVEMSAAIADPQNEIVTFVSTDELMN